MNIKSLKRQYEQMSSPRTSTPPRTSITAQENIPEAFEDTLFGANTRIDQVARNIVDKILKILAKEKGALRNLTFMPEELVTTRSSSIQPNNSPQKKQAIQAPFVEIPSSANSIKTLLNSILKPSYSLDTLHNDQGSHPLNQPIRVNIRNIKRPIIEEIEAKLINSGYSSQLTSLIERLKNAIPETNRENNNEKLSSSSQLPPLPFLDVSNVNSDGENVNSDGENVNSDGEEDPNGYWRNPTSNNQTSSSLF